MSEARNKRNPYTEDEIEALRTQLKELREREDMTYAALSKESDIAQGTLSLWMTGKYLGDNSKIAWRVERFIEARGDRSKVRATAASAGFVETETAKAIMRVLAYAQSLPDIVTITGSAGVGKSSAFCEYTRRGVNVFKIVADPSLHTIRGLLGALATACGVYESSHLTYRVTEAVMRRLRGTNGLIIIDEAQHLDAKQLDQLRAFHDQVACGIVLGGNEGVVGRLEGKGRSEFAQLHSRVGMRLRLSKPKAGDVAALLGAWAVEDAEATTLLRTLAQMPGALRNMDRTLRLAKAVAAMEERPVTAADIRMAYQQRAGQPLPEAA